MNPPTFLSSGAFASRFYPLSGRRIIRAAALLGLGLLVIPAAGTAQQVVYNNTTGTIVGFQANGGAASDTGSTALLADDITFAAGAANRNVTSFTLAVGDSDKTGAEPAVLTVEFFATNGTGGGPGTLLGSATKIDSFSNGLTTETFSAVSLFTVPANGQIWAGFYFTGSAGGNPTRLNSLGSYTEDPVAIGSSNAATFFIGTGTATTGGSPAGTIAANPNSGQPANLGMAFVVPEPSSVVLTALAGAGLLSLAASRWAKS